MISHETLAALYDFIWPHIPIQRLYSYGARCLTPIEMSQYENDNFNPEEYLSRDTLFLIFTPPRDLRMSSSITLVTNVYELDDWKEYLTINLADPNPAVLLLMPFARFKKLTGFNPALS